MAPCFQKCTSELEEGVLGWFFWLVFYGRLHVLPADTGTLHSDGNLAFLESLAILNLCLGGTRLSHPEIVSRVGEDADVLHGGLEGGGSLGGRHVDLVAAGGVSHRKTRQVRDEGRNYLGEEEVGMYKKGRKSLTTLPSQTWLFSLWDPSSRMWTT
jgi:hypothetical protein